MTDALRIFLAALASTPVAALVVTLGGLTGDAYVDFKHVMGVFAAITVLFVLLVLAIGGMYFVWTWAL